MASTRTHPEPQEMRGQAADVESQHVPGAGGEEHKKSAKKSDEPEVGGAVRGKRDPGLKAPGFKIRFCKRTTLLSN